MKGGDLCVLEGGEEGGGGGGGGCCELQNGGGGGGKVTKGMGGDREENGRKRVSA